MIPGHPITNSKATLTIFHSNHHQQCQFSHTCAPNQVSTTHLGSHCPPTSIGTPPTHLLALCHYHHSSPINSKSIFRSKPCQNTLRKVNMCKYLPIRSIIILPDDVYKSSKIMLPKEGLCL